MRVFLVDVVYGEGSTGQIVRDLAEALIADGHDAICGYGRGPINSDPKSVKYGVEIETYCHFLASRALGINSVFSKFSTRKLINEIEKFEPHVIHLHELHGYHLDMYSLIDYLKKKKIPVILTLHSEFMYTGNCGNANDCTRWKESCGKCPAIDAYPTSWFFDFSKMMKGWKERAFADFHNLVITTPSKWLAERALESRVFKNRIVVIPNGIDVNTFAVGSRSENPFLTGNDTGDKTIISVTGPSKQKGATHIVSLAENLKEYNVNFYVAGIDENLFPSSRNPNVVNLGFVRDRQILANYYRNADLYLLTSKSETFSFTCVEALACGTPIIGFKAGAPEEVAPPPYGFFVEQGDIDGLSRFIIAYLQGFKDFPGRKQCSSYARKYSKEIMTSRFLALYKEVAGQ